LRARLSALSADPDILQALPPAVSGPTASQAWFGAGLDALRMELQQRWAAEVAEGWAERHAETQAQRKLLSGLRALADNEAAPDATRDLEILRLTMKLEPDTDLRQAFADYNAAHPDEPHGLFLEGCVRLDHDEPEGLDLLDRAMELDPGAIRPGCERAYAFLMKRGETVLALSYEARWHAAPPA
jgi:hypothetical protein